MIFGTQYFRPPFPYEFDWERDLKQIRAMNFNTVKIWAVWNCIEKTPGTYDFSELDRLTALCRKNDLGVIINTIVEGAPYFTGLAHDDHYYRKADGTVLRYSGPANIPSAGWPGMCPDSPAALKMICGFIRETAKHYSTNDAVIGIDVWNEPHLEPMFDYPGELLCYCDHSRTKFIEWLKNKYGELEILNEKWFRRYTEWEQIDPPIRFGTYTDMIDWRRFWLWNLSDWLRSRVSAAREGAPDMMIQTHVAFSGFMGANNDGGLGNELGDEFLLAKEVDTFGFTSFPLWLMGEEYHFGHLINVEIVAESSRNKMFYQTELQGGPGKAGLLGGITPTYGDIRVWNYNVIAGGGKGVLYWQYGIEPAGMESPGFGLMHSNGSLSERAISAADCAKHFRSRVPDGAVRVLPVNGIYLSRSSDLLTYAAKEEHQYNFSIKGIYRALYERGIPCRFVHQDYLTEAISGEGLENLYLPMTLSLSEKEKEELFLFVNQGGRLILECGTGMYTDTGEMDMYFSFLEMLFGTINPAVEKNADPGLRISTGNGTSFECGDYRQLFSSFSPNCSISGRYPDGSEAALTARHGRGSAVLLPGFPAQQFYKKRDAATGNFLASMFSPEGYAQFAALEAEDLVIRLLETEDTFYVFAVNHHKEESPFRLQINNKSISGTVPPEDGRIFTVEK